MVKVNRRCLFGIMTLFTSISIIHDTATAENIVNFSGNKHNPVEIIPDIDTGLDVIFVLRNTTGVSFTYQSESTSEVRFYSFDNRGISFMTPIDNITKDNKKYTVNILNSDSGYIIEDNNKVYRFWIINYNDNPLSIKSISPSDSSDCNATVIKVFGNGAPIIYYTIFGRRMTLSREIESVYYTLEFDSEVSRYIQVKKNKFLPSFSDRITITPPVYCNTTLFISGDRFLREWGLGISLESEPIITNSLEVYSEAIPHIKNEYDTSNTISDNSDFMGGSAPFDVTFKGYATDAATYTEWQFASDENFEDITHRFHESEIDYSFTKEGTTFVRFSASNSDGSCEAISNTFPICIGTSELKIPNAFSPDGDGINDVWKVAYRSLLDFECSIFDRHGHEIYRFSDPSSGWDGKKNGKTVGPGVYFYTVKATGADGRRYNKSGDINIINRKIN